MTTSCSVKAKKVTKTISMAKLKKCSNRCDNSRERNISTLFFQNTGSKKFLSCLQRKFERIHPTDPSLLFAMSAYNNLNKVKRT